MDACGTLGHVCTCVHMWVHVHFVWEGYWQYTDRMLIIQLAGGWGLSGRQVGVTALRSDETITLRRRERGGHMSGQRTMTISCQSQLTWTQHYQDPIIYSNALKWDTHKQTHMLSTYCTCISDWSHLAKLSLKTRTLWGRWICQISRSCGEYFFIGRRAKNDSEAFLSMENMFSLFTLLAWFTNCLCW